MKRVLVAGFGNLYRRDDGAGFAVVNALRKKMGQRPLGHLEDGFDELGHHVDTVVLHQLVPELADTVAEYDLLVLVDAHVNPQPEPLHEEPITVSQRTMSLISHQSPPSLILELAFSMHKHAPAGVLLSIRGHDLNFGQGLSRKTAALVPLAVDRILELVKNAAGRSPCDRLSGRNALPACARPV